MTIDISDSDASQSNGSSDASRGTGTSGTSGTSSATDTSPTGGTEASQTGGDSDAGGQSASQSGSSSDSTTDESGTSGGTGPWGSSSGDSSTGDSSTGGCMPKEGGTPPVELGSADDLGAAGSHVLLAKAAITNVTGSLLTGGNVGLSPAAGTFITGFSMIADPSGVFSTSASVAAPGKIFAANFTQPTPTHLTTAVLGMQTAYLDAASRIPTDFLNLNGGDLGGLTLGPGIYTWGSTVLIPDDVTLDGCEEDVWIFQIANDLDVSAAKNVILSGGARARNVFWQIAGQATIHANAHMEGIILSKTGITFQTNASLAGRALAQSMIALDDNAVTAPTMGQ